MSDRNERLRERAREIERERGGGGKRIKIEKENTTLEGQFCNFKSSKKAVCVSK